MPRHLSAPQVVARRATSTGPLRLQAAIVRALLDELDAAAPPDDAAPILEQLGDELERLGRDALRISAAIARQATTSQKDEEIARIPHWLPLVAF